jgi:hypothetical protein
MGQYLFKWIVSNRSSGVQEFRSSGVQEFRSSAWEKRLEVKLLS